MIKAKFTVLLAFAVIAGCTPAEPPGPAERIGKSIDQLTKDTVSYTHLTLPTNREV